MDAVVTRGCLDFADAREDSVVVGGWVGAFDGFDAVSFDAAAGGEAVRVREARLGIDSPDIERDFSSLPNAGSCRFYVELEVRAPSDRGFLVGLTPCDGDGRRGLELFTVVGTTIPDPPADALEAVGGGGFSATEFLGYFVGLGGLEPADSVLEVGCGIGRMAVPIAYYLREAGRYRGFDIVPAWIEWAERNIAARHPSMRFDHLDVRNGEYNPGGTIDADRVELPYGDGEFDFALLTSVLTHLRSAEAVRYLGEVARVLRAGGSCVASCFLIDAGVRAAVEAGESDYALEHEVDGAWALDPNTPERAIGFERRAFGEWLAQAGLEIVGEHPGAWPGRRKFLSYQDVLVLRKT